MTAKPQSRKFLCIIDESPECHVAVRFAARRAERSGGRTALVHILEPSDFQHWMAVEARMREEAYQEAERALHQAAAIVNSVSGDKPELLIREGKPREQIRELLQDDPSISILVLGASTAKDGPGPLVSAITGVELGQGFPIPITIVPGGLSDDEIDALT